MNYVISTYAILAFHENIAANGNCGYNPRPSPLHFTYIIRFMHSRRLFPPLLNLILLSFLIWGTSARAGEERLFFKEGGELIGSSHGIRSGKMIWKLSSGAELLVPLNVIERIEYGTPAPKSDGANAESSEAKSDSEDSADSKKTELDTANSDKSEEADTVQPAGAEEVAPPPEESLIAEEDLGRWDSFTERLEDHYDTVVFKLEDWTKRFEIGGRFLSGNTDNQNFNVNIDFEKQANGKLLQIENGGEYAETDGDPSANRWFSNLTADFDKKGNWILFITAKNETNEFQNLDYRGSYSGGLGYKFINDGPKRLITRLGPGLTYEKFHDPTDTRTTPDIFGEIEFNWPLHERIFFEHKTRANPSVEDINVMRLVSNYGLLFNLDQAAEWSLKLGLKHDYNSEPNTGLKPNDYATTVLLVYKRK